MDDDPLSFLSNNLTSRSPVHGVSERRKRRRSRISPTEIVHLPETGEREYETEERNGENIDQHPTWGNESARLRKTRGRRLTDVLEFTMENVDDRLESVDGTEHDEGSRRDSLTVRSDEVDELERFVSFGFHNSKSFDSHIRCRRRYEIERVSTSQAMGQMSTYVTGAIKVEARSMKTTNRIEKQQKPHIRSTKSNSERLWTVELIHRRRCDMRIFQSSGAIVCASASRQNDIL